MRENDIGVTLDREWPMTLGLAERQGDLLDDVIRFCDASLGEGSVFGFLHRERERLFPDEFFADLFADTGRRSVPPSVVATVMVLQRLEGLSDREAVDRFTYDARWRYAAGVAAMTGMAARASPIRCWWTCGPVWTVRTARTGFSRRGWKQPRRRGWWGAAGCWTRRRSTTRWRPWTRSR
jgi:Transposase domain (DUF772).